MAKCPLIIATRTQLVVVQSQPSSKTCVDPDSRFPRTGGWPLEAYVCGNHFPIRVQLNISPTSASKGGLSGSPKCFPPQMFTPIKYFLPQMFSPTSASKGQPPVRGRRLSGSTKCFHPSNVSIHKCFFSLKWFPPANFVLPQLLSSPKCCPPPKCFPHIRIQGPTSGPREAAVRGPQFFPHLRLQWPTSGPREAAVRVRQMFSSN